VDSVVCTGGIGRSSDVPAVVVDAVEDVLDFEEADVVLLDKVLVAVIDEAVDVAD